MHFDDSLLNSFFKNSKIKKDVGLVDVHSLNIENNKTTEPEFVGGHFWHKMFSVINQSIPLLIALW